MSLQEFNQAVEDVKNLNGNPDNTELLEIYALFKQATVGDNTTAKPGLLDFRGKAKWEAWEEKKGKSKEDSQSAYVAKVNELIQKYGKKWKHISLVLSMILKKIYVPSNLNIRELKVPEFFSHIQVP